VDKQKKTQRHFREENIIKKNFARKKSLKKKYSASCRKDPNFIWQNQSPQELLFLPILTQTSVM
jgi:hypothetical protein